MGQILISCERENLSTSPRQTKDLCIKAVRTQAEIVKINFFRTLDIKQRHQQPTGYLFRKNSQVSVKIASSVEF